MRQNLNVRGGSVSPDVAIYLLLLAGILIFFWLFSKLSSDNWRTIGGLILMLIVIGAVFSALFGL